MLADKVIAQVTSNDYPETRRLLACWNAFEKSGLTTEQIEAGAFDKMHADRNRTIGEREDARAARVELIEALRQIRREYGAFGTVSGEALTVADALLAKHAPKVTA